MLKRYVELRSSLFQLEDNLLDAVLLGERDERRIDILCGKFEHLDSVNKVLQSDSMKLSGVRILFDAVICKYPEIRARLNSHAQIVHQPDFESAVCKIQDRKVELLTEEERHCVKDLRKQAATKELAESN